MRKSVRSTLGLWKTIFRGDKSGYSVCISEVAIVVRINSYGNPSRL